MCTHGFTSGEPTVTKLNPGETTAERARSEQWSYEQFLEALLEAEVYARDASGARTGD
jgi:hypothetical protein